MSAPYRCSSLKPPPLAAVIYLNCSVLFVLIGVLRVLLPDWKNLLGPERRGEIVVNAEISDLFHLVTDAAVGESGREP